MILQYQTMYIRQNDSSVRGSPRWWPDREITAVLERATIARSSNVAIRALIAQLAQLTRIRGGDAARSAVQVPENWLIPVVLERPPRRGRESQFAFSGQKATPVSRRRSFHRGIASAGHIRIYCLIVAGATMARGWTMYVCHREELPVCSWDTGSSRRNTDNNPGAP